MGVGKRRKICWPSTVLALLYLYMCGYPIPLPATWNKLNNEGKWYFHLLSSKSCSSSIQLQSMEYLILSIFYCNYQTGSQDIKLRLIINHLARLFCACVCAASHNAGYWHFGLVGHISPTRNVDKIAITIVAATFTIWIHVIILYFIHSVTCSHITIPSCFRVSDTDV